MKKISKEAKKLRETALFSKLKPEYKFDSKTFNPQSIVENINELSPKILTLMNKIADLDKKDLENESRLYKHIIYCDLDGIHGVKLIASVLMSINKWKLAYDNNFKMIKGTNNETFGLLTSSTVFGKPLTAGVKRNVLQTMNKRPENVEGKNMRFLLLDNSFKEGIDVYDVKYHHMLEPVLTQGEQKQIIGRGTRYCGQAGLPFDPKKGWTLYVYKYDLKYDNENTYHDMYSKELNIDTSKFVFEKEIDDLMKISSVDKELTNSIHLLEKYNKHIIKKVRSVYDNIEKEKQEKKEWFKISLYGRQFSNFEKIDCKKGCNSPLSVFNIELLIGLILLRDVNLNKIFNMKTYKPLICHKVLGLPKLCYIYNKIWLDRKQYLEKHYDDIIKNLDHLERQNKILHQHSQTIRNFMKEYKPSPKLLPNPIPPNKQLKFYELNNYINFNYKKYKWDKMIIENGCLTTGGAELVNLTKSQEFIKDYFTPKNPYKGMLLYHSVGTGKTCSGIATATASFQKQGYTILWVTRASLKQDIWKNMFEKVCHTILADNIKNGLQVDVKAKDGIRTKIKKAGIQWFEPISYKQFANLLLKKNKFYEELKKRNGTEDILKKTLIIIDEAHKLFTEDLKAQERPNVEIMKRLIQSSYDKSGENSVRLLLMTATPITEDPMSSIKLMNMLENKEQLTENYEDFKKIFCHEDGTIIDDKISTLMHKFSGKISYLNRSNDIRQFAYPIITDILCK